MKQIAGGTRQSQTVRVLCGRPQGTVEERLAVSLYWVLSPAEQDPGEQNAGEDTWAVCRKAFQVEGTS